MRASNRLGSRRLSGKKIAKSQAKRSGLKGRSFETLEDRSLLAANPLTADLVGGELTITGTASKDVILVQRTSTDGLQVSWNGKALSKTFALSSVNKVTILGGDSDDHIIVNNIPKTVVIDGGIGANDLAVTGKVGPNNFILDANSVTLNGHVHTFSNVQLVRMNGGKSDDLLTIAALPAVATEFNGMSGVDEIVGPNTTNLWKITQFNTGTLNSTFSFSGVENLTGGTANDRFRFFNGKSISGNIKGGPGGTDILDYENYTTAVKVNPTNRSATGTGGIQDIEGFIGGSGSGSVTLLNSDPNVWHITGVNSGTVNGIAFSNAANLAGGGGVDTFIFEAGGSISGTIDGGAGADVINRSQRTDSATIDLSKIVSIEQIIGASNVATVDTKLLGTNSATTWNITGTNAGTVSGIAFSNITSFTGGSASDTFTFAPDVQIAKGINAGAGTDTLNFSGDLNARTVDLKTFTNFESILGGTNAGDKLIGADVANTWNITSNNGGKLNTTTSFSSFENLTGGSQTDSFVFANTFGVDGKIDGVAGANTLNYAAYTTSVTVNLSAKSATKVFGGLANGFDNITAVVGGTQSDTLIGADLNDTWNITSNNGGNIRPVVGTSNTTFTSFENLTGGTQDDTFVFSDGIGVSGKIDGGLGRNTLDYSAFTTSVTVDLSTKTATKVTGGIDRINDVVGGSADDTLTGDNLDNLLDGSAGNDTIHGGDGNDTLFGNNGDDKLFGDDGRDLLFGNLGVDTLDGGAGEDILFDTQTTFSGSVASTDALLTAWTSLDPYATRVNNLRNGTTGVPGAPLLNSTTVQHDDAVDTLTGGADSDWFFAGTVGSVDVITDLNVGTEVVN